VVITREEAILWLNTVLRNSKGNIDSNKIRSSKYKKYLNSLNSLIEGDYTLLQKIWLIDRNLLIPPKCYCGNTVLWVKSKREYSLHCSALCARTDPKVIEKRKQTNIQKYGATAPTKNKEVIKKMRATNLIKYGVETSFERENFKEKASKTLLLNYGVDNPQKNKNIREKTRITNIKKYGASTPLQGIQYKKSLEIQHMKKVYNRLITGDRTENRVKPLFSFDEYTGINDMYKWECTLCNREFYDHLQDGHIPRCKHCFPKQNAISSYEHELIEFLSSLGITNIVSSVRNLISPYELDIYLPDYNLAIELNGIYWHSELGGNKSKYYHLKKLKLCLEKNINLIQIFDDEWINKKDIVMSILKNRLSIVDNKYFARKLIIKDVLVKEQKAFLIDNHLQGYIPCSLALGLYKDDTLISLATFSKARYAKKNWELLRFVTKKGYKVVGGLSKLISEFKKRNTEILISYCDRRYFTGAGYESSGFKFIGTTEPNYYYMKKYRERLSRVRFQKHKLRGKLEKFDETLTEWELMQLNGYDRIWDCGNAVYELMV
jgi:hypothetical protein